MTMSRMWLCDLSPLDRLKVAADAEDRVAVLSIEERGTLRGEASAHLNPAHAREVGQYLIELAAWLEGQS